MPQLNRDKESLYPPGKLSVWFLGSSALLVASLVWMLADDFIRPWKSVQRDFWERDTGVLTLQKEMDEWTLRGEGVADEPAREKQVAALKSLTDRIAAAERALQEPETAKKIAGFEADITEQKARYDEADRHIKMDKGEYAAQKYEYDVQVLKHGTESKESKAVAAVLNRIGSDQIKFEADQQVSVVEREKAAAKIEDLRAPLKALQTERDKLFDDLAKTTKALEGADATVHKNQWRNAPFAELVGPSIRIEKAVLEFIHEDYNFATSPKVDMCMTCHRGVDRDEMSEQKIGPLLAWFLESRLGSAAWKKLGGAAKFYGHPNVRSLRAWLSGSPSLLDLYSTKDLEDALGGREGEKKTESESLRRFRERHLDGQSLEDGAKTLLKPFAIRRVEWAHPQLDLMVGSKSKHPMEKIGCTTCHQGQGRRLEFVRATHTPNSEEQQKAWVEKYSWVEAEMVDQPMVPMRHVEGQCLKCHLPNIEFRPKTETLDRWKDDPKERESDKQAPQPVDGTQAHADGHWHPETYVLGADTIRRYGCLGCHLVKNFGGSPGYTDPEFRGADGRSADFGTPLKGSVTMSSGIAKVGPDLTHIADKTTRDWTMRWIETPTAYRIDTRMPAFYRYREHRNFLVVPGPDGKPLEKTIVLDPTERDNAQLDVEILAITAYLFDGQNHDPMKDFFGTSWPDRPRAWLEASRADAYPTPPQGDPAKGRELFYSVGCFACHLGPDDRPGSGLDPAIASRFSKPIGEGADAKPRREELPPGPRLTALGSKVNPKWLYAWLAEPRHYNSVTKMPNLRWRDETTADGKTVTRAADQLRADVVAYLTSFKDDEFDARKVPNPAATPAFRWSLEHKRVLASFYSEWNKTVPDESDAEPETSKKRKKTVPEEEAERIAFAMIDKGELNRLLVSVGRDLIRARGCFGCHNIEGFEYAQPIGKELTEEGAQDIHKFDFGLLGHPYTKPNELGKHVEETRWGFVEEKLRQPRVFDLGKHKPRWQDKLRMPKFNLRDDEREAVAGVVLGWIYDLSKEKSPLKPQARYSWPSDMRAILGGRAVIERYGCNQCHTIERRTGVLTAAQLDGGLETWMLPPNLFGEGNRVDAGWLFKFLKKPHDVRPGVIQRMPMFRLSDDEAAALVDYFSVLAGRKDRLSTDLDDEPLSDAPYEKPVTISVKKGSDEKQYVAHSLVEEAKAFFEARGCVECHLPKGTPGVDPSKGGTAPPFTLARERLRRAWMTELLAGPQRQIAGGTKMPDHWSAISRRNRSWKPGNTITVDFPQFLVSARAIPEAQRTNDVVAQEQMKTLVRYLKYHYQSTASAPPGK